MKRLLVCCVGIVSLISFSSVRAFIKGRTYFNVRSESTNAARRLVGWQEYIHRDEMEECYGALTLALEYKRSFSPACLANYFFGTDKLTFSGSRVAVRGADDILADYFGLPTDFEGSVVFEPRVEQFILDFNWYLGLDPCLYDSYIRVHAPVVYQRRTMGMCACGPDESGELSYPAGYMGPALIERDQMAESIAHAWSGATSVGDIQPLKYGKICGRQDDGALSEIHVIVGKNYLNEPCRHFGANLRVGIPTGTFVTSEYLFEPVVGNGRHWEVGVGLTGKTSLWISEDEESAIMLYGDWNFMHAFKARQKRSYDVCANGPGSRYMLIQEMGNPVVGGLAVDNVAAQNQYHAKLMPAINKTTLESEISIGLKTDFVLKVAFSCSNFSFDVGYNFWARTSERLQCREKFPANCFALKGDAQIYGYTDTTEPNSFVGLNATQSKATINAGQGDGSASQQFLNENVDNAGPIEFATQPLGQSALPIANTGIIALNQVNGSNQAVLIRDCDLDECSALAPSALSHKFFVHAQYECGGPRKFLPFIGVGAEVEFDGGSSSRRTDVLSQWGAWLKAGLTY